MTPQALANATPEQMGNDPKMEMLWAEKAHKHSEVYMNILKMFPDKSKLKLTGADQDIYRHFRKVFPTLDVKKVTDMKLKSAPAKRKWNPFCTAYENKSTVIVSITHTHTLHDSFMSHSLINLVFICW